jgi:serine/threonine protein kinase
VTTSRGSEAAAFPRAARRLKDYKLLGVLATGGMAQLFLARRDSATEGDELLVIKRIVPALAGEPESVVRFLDEARIAATLQHANIVRSHEVDVVDGEVFLVMEFLHGQDVRSVLRRANRRGVRLPLENVVAIAAAVAAGLDHAHERCGTDGRSLEIVHRDVSPHNVLVSYDGSVKIIDFGIAKATTNLSRTRHGVFAGKVAYASPEQLRCEKVDRRSDIFSLGLTLFELIAGRQPFPLDNDFALLRALTEDDIPRVSEVDPDCPPELDGIVMRALAREKGERYSTARALQLDLEAFAVTAGLDLSAASLSRLLEELFRDDLDQWRAARDAGITLERHVMTRSRLDEESSELRANESTKSNTARRAARAAVPARAARGRSRRPGATVLMMLGFAVGMLAAGLAGVGYQVFARAPILETRLPIAPASAAAAEPPPSISSEIDAVQAGHAPVGLPATGPGPSVSPAARPSSAAASDAPELSRSRARRVRRPTAPPGPHEPSVPPTREVVSAEPLASDPASDDAELDELLPR